MLDESRVLLMSEPIEEMYMDASSRLLINISRHLGKDAISTTVPWEIAKLSEVSQITRENSRIIEASTSGKDDKIQATVNEAMAVTTDDVDEVCKDLPIVRSGMVAETSYEIASSSIQETSTVNGVMLQSSVSQYQGAVLEASARSERLLAEGMDIKKVRKDALQYAIMKMASQGITGYVDRAGRHWTADAYIAMCIRTAIGNTAIQGQRARSAEYGVSTFQISKKTPARELCAPYIGWICSWDGITGTILDFYGKEYMVRSIYDTSYGEPAGIFGINCGHRPLTFVNGYSIIRDSVLTEEQQKENAKVYSQTQQMRAMERKVRELKTQAVALDAAGLGIPDTLAKRIQDRTNVYKEFCRANGLTERPKRMWVDGYDKSLASTVSAAARNNRRIA